MTEHISQVLYKRKPVTPLPPPSKLDNHTEVNTSEKIPKSRS